MLKLPQNQPSLWPESAKLKGLRVGIYGGSFNPAHDGHRHVALAALNRLKLDRILFLVSPGNPLKSDSDMATFDDRVAATRAIAQNHPKFIVSAIEKKLDSRFSANTLKTMTNSMSHSAFVWIMGADSLAIFDKWYAWRAIADTLKIAVFDRPGYAQVGLNSQFARVYRRHRVKPTELMKAQTPAWCFVTLPRHPASASDIRSQLQEQAAKRVRKET